jgi:hypothetical protein
MYFDTQLDDLLGFKVITKSHRLSARYKKLLRQEPETTPLPYGTIYNRSSGRLVKRERYFKGDVLRPAFAKKVLEHNGGLLNYTAGLHKESHTKKSGGQFEFVDFPIGTIRSMSPNGTHVFSAAAIQNIVERMGTRPGNRFQVRLIGRGGPKGTSAAQHAYLPAFSAGSYQHSADKLGEYANNVSGQYDEAMEWHTIRVSYAHSVGMIGQGGMKMQGKRSAEERWLVYDTVSETNCFWRALYVCKNQAKASTITAAHITNGAAATKKRYKSVTKNQHFVGIDDLQNIVNRNSTKKFAIQLYDNLFQKIGDVIKPAGAYITHEIQLVKGHFKPLLRWANTDTTLLQSAKEMVAARKAKQLPSDEPVMIDEPHFPKRTKKADSKFGREPVPLDDKIAAWDIEATGNTATQLNATEFKPYMVGVAWNEDGEERFHRETGLDCLHVFAEWVAGYSGANGDAPRFFNGYTFMAHNGGKFDLPLLIANAFSRDNSSWGIDETCELNGRYIHMRTKANGVSVKWKDSYSQLPASLDKLCRDFSKVITCQKMTGSIDFEKVNIDNWHTVKDLDRYHECDCRSLLQIMQLYAKDVHECFNINVTACYTAASLAKKHFLQNCYNKKRSPLFKPSSDQDAFIRSGYFGGRVEMGFKGYWNKRSWYYDYTSHFPAEMAKQLYPCGKPTWVSGGTLVGKLMARTLHGTVEVRCRTRPDMHDEMPLHGVYKDNKLVFPILKRWRNLHLYSEEYYAGVDSGIYEYEPIKAVSYPFRSRYLKQGIEQLFERKAAAKAAGQKALTLACKIVANSSYGWPGIRCMDRTGVEIGPSGDWRIHYEAGTLLHTTDRGPLSVSNVTKDLEIKATNVQISAAVSSNARIRLWQMMRDFQKAGIDVLYCDTDSVIVSKDMKKYPDLMAEYCWDGTGDALGSLKNEADELFADPASHPEYSTTSGISFDSVRLCALKSYCLVKAASPGFEAKTIMKMKGLTQKNGVLDDKCKNTMKFEHGMSDADIEHTTHDLCTDDYDKMLSGGFITQNQSQFRCPITNHCSERKFMHINVVEQPKRFKSLYNKGNTGEDGWVSPLII